MVTDEVGVEAAQTLAQALATHLERWSERTGIKVETWALPTTDVEAYITRSVLAAVREALANVERHSGAETVSVAVTVGATGLRMTISDDGMGSDAPVEGRGIELMRTAFANADGDLDFNFVPGGGVTVTGAIPFGRR
ncbi:sensor histidine kinase [Spongiactinospora gelatinilytica]|uniref:sensor histidine kinase n=1 Tax=Spongiactinospora gelatinilytica TaxID=2666298 RepID=UPI0011B9462D|nr:ATP-binding protein [Spongiactinospora gelatinilytica]